MSIIFADSSSVTESVHQNSFACTKCKRVFERRCDLIDHVQSGACNKELTCEICGRYKTDRARNLRRHQSSCSEGDKDRKIVCELCGKYETTRPFNMRRHRLVCVNHQTKGMFDDGDNSNLPDSPSSCALPSSSNNTNFTCDICRRPHGNMANLIEHRRVHASVPTDMPTAMSNEFAAVQIGKHAFGGHLCEYDLVSHEPGSEVRAFFDLSRDLVLSLIRALSSTHFLRGRMVARVRYFKLNEAGRRGSEFFLFFPSLPMNLLDLEGEEWFETHSHRIIQLIEEMNRGASNIEFDSIERVFLKFTREGNAGGHGMFPLPPALAKKRQTIVNVDTTSECFKFALLSILHYNDVPNKGRSNKDSYRQWEDELDFGDINPDEVRISDIHKIERLNNLKINLHVWEPRTPLTVRYNNRQTIAPKTVNVLLISYQGLAHYCGIVSLKRLYQDFDRSHHSTEFCERCCREFSSWRKNSNGIKESLEEHYRFCREGRLSIEAVPSEKSYQYEQFSAEEKPLVVCYSDIESYISPQDKKHCPYAIGLYPVYHEHFTERREHATMRTWTGENCIQNYLAYLDRFVRELDIQVDSMMNKAMIIDPAEQHAFDIATHCPRCNAEFTVDGNQRKCRDHCHVTGKYRGPLCHRCNSRLRLKRRVLPVVFHNFKGYDGHLICKQAIGEMPGWHLSIIPTTHEKYMSLRARVEVSKNKNGKPRFFQIVFLDSFQFLSSSLAALVANLDSLPFTEKRMHARFPGISDAVIRRKGVFPYSYFNSPTVLQETSLPSIASFKDDLSGAECSADEYAHAQRAWVELGCRTFREYLVAYLHLDIYLLTDVFERFRCVSLQEDGLDPVHFVSLPGLSYQSCFKRSGEKIDLLQDIDMIRLFERGIRGGLTFVNKHQVQARIPELNNNQDGNIHLAYIDQNNLYGSSLCRPLPHSEFTWLEQSELERFSDPSEILDLDDEADYGYLFEVDLKYPSELHASTSDFPLAPEKAYIEQDMFSPYMTNMYAEMCEARGSNGNYRPYQKLLLTQYDRSHYVCHYSILKFYLRMGMQLERVRSAIRFRQKRFVEPYIKYNSEKRALATNAFDKDYYKLKNNSFFGKTMEDVRHRIDYRLLTRWDRVERLTASPLFVDFDIFSESVVGVHMFKSRVVLNKPVYIGQAVLEYSKLEMYQLYYSILCKCPLIRQPDLVGGDTDSFFLALKTDRHVLLSDIFKYLSKYLDSSNYPQDHPMYSSANKAKLGCFKDEAAGRIIEEMILLRPKMYSMKFLGEATAIKRAKGISRHLVASTSHETYREVFLEAKETEYQMTILRSALHTINTVTFRKRGLSSWEDKRCWLNANSSLPHGSSLSELVPAKRRRVFPTPVSGDVSTSLS